MPTYAYKCHSCQSQHEISQKITDAPLTICPSCQAPNLKRGPGGGIGLSFKGSGFYITDYNNKQNTPSNPNSSSAECCPYGKNQCG